MLVVGLTGGIGSGKSTAAAYFRDLGVTVLDADDIVKQLLSPTSPCYKKILEHFGDKISDEQQILDKQRLKHLIFHDQQAKNWLESLLHPEVRRIMQAKIKKLRPIAKLAAPYCIAMIPLLIETLPNPLINRILLIDCDEAQQIVRAQARDGNVELIRAIIKQQASREARLQQADDVIDNNGDMEALLKQVQQLHEIYAQFSL